MINRVLIRIKVVQLLYSYLLNQSEFRIAEIPADSSKDTRYAFTLYFDLLLLLMELSGYDVRAGRVGLDHPLTGGESSLLSNKLAKALMANDQIRAIISRSSSSVEHFDSLLLPLVNKIKDSEIYRSFLKLKERKLNDESQLWSVVTSTILSRDPQILELARKQEGFTNAGFERAFEMVTTSLNGFTENRSLLTEARNALDASFDKAYELYHRLLQLMIEITRLQELRLDNAKHKFLPTPDDLNPPMRFVENSLVRRLEHSADMQKFIEDNKISWADDDLLIRHLLDKILQSEIYANYMAAPSATYADDCEFWRKVYKTIILPSDDLAEVLESKSIFWNDDLDIMGTFVLKTIKRFAASPDKPVALLPKYKDEIDEKFGPQLFLDAVKNTDTYKSYIERFRNQNWDMDRLPFMDIVIIICAMAELLNFPNIPVAVTVNEYVEMANCYSTSKSGQFVNGMLSTIITTLKEEGKLLKPIVKK